MERGQRFLRIILTAAVFALAAYAFSVIWSPENIARFFEKKDAQRHGTEDVRPLRPVGPPPVITFDAIQHILERHVDEDNFPEKSKFIEDVDITDMIEITYLESNVVQREDDKYIYEYKSEMIVGTRGQRCLRLVTAADGTVITLYPIFDMDEQHKEAA
jgi:hypothetical protein